MVKISYELLQEILILKDKNVNTYDIQKVLDFAFQYDLNKLYYFVLENKDMYLEGAIDGFKAYDDEEIKDIKYEAASMNVKNIKYEIGLRINKLEKFKEELNDTNHKKCLESRINELEVLLNFIEVGI